MCFVDQSASEKLNYSLEELHTLPEQSYDLKFNFAKFTFYSLDSVTCKPSNGRRQ